MRAHRIVTALFAIGLLAPVAATAQDPVRVYATTVSRGMLGFYSETIDGAGNTRVIVDVVPESPAAKAGLQKGDTLVRINGLAASPQVMSAPFEPGDTVTLRIRRDGRERDVTVVAAERSNRFTYVFPDSVDRRFTIYMDRMRAGVDSTHSLPSVFMRRFESDSGGVFIFGTDTLHIPTVVRGRMPVEMDSLIRRFRVESMPRMFPDSGVHFFTPGEGRIFSFEGDSGIVRGFDILATNAVFGMRAVAGAELAPLNPALAEYFGATDGVLVLNAADRTPAERAGLRGGDVIVRANDTPIRSVTELRRAIEAAHGGDVTLRVLRHGRNVDVTLQR